MRYTSLQAWLDWQQTLHPKAIDMSLDRINQVATLAGIGEAALHSSPTKLITVGGTNGKGSCVRALEQILLAQGCSVGAFTSPHVLRYNERIRLNGVEASDEQIISAFYALDSARGDISLTYFEFCTLAAAWLFKNTGVDYWIMEVGLGGRLDSVNIWSADIAIITSIDIDHVQWLGDNREDIGREKAGIFRPGQLALCADLNPPQSVINAAKENNTELLLAGTDFGWQDSQNQWHWWFGESSNRAVEQVLPKPNLPQPSVAAALAALKLLGQLPGPDNLAKVFKTLSLAGRYQRVRYQSVSFVLDVAHNPQAVRLLADKLAGEAMSAKPIAIFAALADKDIATILEIMSPLVDQWRLPHLPGVARAQTPDWILTELQAKGLKATVDKDMKESLSWVTKPINKAAEDQLVVVFGSFHTIEAFLLAVKSKPAENGTQQV